MFYQILENFSPATSILICTAVAVFSIAFVSHLRFLFRYPGPWGVPLLGYYPFLREDFYVQLHELAKVHGEAYVINIAGQTFLCLDSIRAVREAHVNKVESFLSRSNKYSLLQHSFENGLLFLNGEAWRVQRKFFAQSMREVGLGPNKEELKGPIGEAVRSTIDTLRKNEEESVDVAGLLSKECTAAVVRLFLGNSVSEEEASKVNEAYLKVVLPMGDINILLVGNFARYFLLPRIRGYSKFLEGKEEMTALLYNIVSDHRANFDPDQQPRDLIEYYLRERALREKKGDPQAKHFTDTALVPTLIQAYGDGSLTIGLVIASFLTELSLHRHAQDALFEEITGVIGTERLPTWEDRAQLPLTYSAIKELSRVTKFFPVITGVECTQETTVLGTRVPKGCITLVNNWSAHHDPKVYKNPDGFDITRFVPGNTKQEDPIIFGLGRRSCAGESLVMTEIFIFLASLLQNFLFLPVTEDNQQNKDNPPFEEVLKNRLRVLPRSSLVQ